MLTTDDGDAALVGRFLAGEDTAFDALYNRYGKSVYTSCYAVLVDEDRATDLTSQTIMVVLRELRGGRAPADLRVWLRRTAYLLAVERANPRVPRPAHPPEIDPAWRVAAAERGELVWDALTSLSLSHRKVLSLRVPQELAVGEIADVLGIEPVRAQRLVDEAYRELERALVAQVVVRSGRQDCQALERLLGKAGWASGPFSSTSKLYRKVAGHIDKCGTCGTTRQQQFIPAQWLPVVIPLLVVPYELRQRILEAVHDLVVGVSSAGHEDSGPDGSAPHASRARRGPRDRKPDGQGERVGGGAAGAQPTSALASSSVLASTSAGTGLGRPLAWLTQLAQRGRAVATTGVSRVTSLPGVTNIVQVVQNNPAIARVVGLIAALATVGTVLVGSQFHQNDDVAQPGVPATTTPSSTATTAPTGFDGGFTTAPTGATTDTGVPGTSAWPPGVPPALPDAGVINSPGQDGPGQDSPGQDSPGQDGPSQDGNVGSAGSGSTTPTSGPTPCTPDVGPPPHGRLIDTLSPTYIYSGQTQLVFYNTATYTPDRVTFGPRTPNPSTRGVLLPYVLVPDNNPHTYQVAVHLHTHSSGPTRYQIDRYQIDKRPPVSVCGGDVTLRFTDTLRFRGPSWWYWILANVSGDAWKLMSVDIYEVTDSGPPPSPPPAGHPDPAKPAPPLVGRLDTLHVRSTNTELSFNNAHSVTAAGGASFVPSLLPASAKQDVVVRVRVPDNNPHTYRLVFSLRSEAATQYQLDGQVAAAPAGDATVQFIVTVQGVGWHSWSLADLNRKIWVFKSCDIYELTG